MVPHLLGLAGNQTCVPGIVALSGPLGDTCPVARCHCGSVPLGQHVPVPEVQEYDAHDAVSLALTRLEGQLGAELRGLATVERNEYPSGHPRFSVYAENPRAADLEWIDWGDEILLTSAGGNWSLSRTTEGIRTLENAVRAVVAGRVRETATYGKWRVEIDGAEIPLVFEGATPVELLPRLRLPAWLRRTRVTRFEPYASPRSR